MRRHVAKYVSYSTPLWLKQCAKQKKVTQIYWFIGEKEKMQNNQTKWGIFFSSWSVEEEMKHLS